MNDKEKANLCLEFCVEYYCRDWDGASAWQFYQSADENDLRRLSEAMVALAGLHTPHVSSSLRTHAPYKAACAAWFYFHKGDQEKLDHALFMAREFGFFSRRAELTPA